MKHEGSLTCSQETCTGPYPEPDEYNPETLTFHSRIILYGEALSGLENREYGRWDPLQWSRDTLYPQKLALTSPTSGGRSVGIVRSRTKATESSF
jgi:hypothetical protein